MPTTQDIKTKCSCEKCGRTMDASQFFVYKDGRRVEMCKKCLTMHIDNFNPDTFLWILEKMDVPYIPQEWNIIRDKIWAEDPSKLQSSSVLGRYLAKMKLNQFRDKETNKPYTWADSEKLQAEYAGRTEKDKAEIQRQFDEGEITEAEYKTLMPAEVAAYQPGISGAIPTAAPVDNGIVYMSEDDLADLSGNLTDEDKAYLAMKWGRLYKVNEWIELEKIYTQMIDSFDIQDADTMNTLILICKTNLKMNQALDINDIDGFQKLSRVSESLRKSAKFTAAQNKLEQNESVDSIGELVNMCEREGFIPRFALDIPQDKVDFTLKDMNEYIYKLITQDLGFGQQIENALKKIQLQKELNEAEQIPDDTIEVDNQDYDVFIKEVEAEKEKEKEVELKWEAPPPKKEENINWDEFEESDE